MTIALRKAMTQAEFFLWAQSEEGRYEFDGIRPVAMTGGNLGHNQIMLATHRALDRHLAGSACRALGPEAGVATVGETVRFPDAVVTCSKFNRSDLLVPSPVVVFEIVSPGSLRVDRVVKLREYQSVRSIRSYVIVESEAPAVTLLSRDEADGPFSAIGLTEDDTLDLSCVGISLAVAELYDGLDFGSGGPG